MNEPDSMNKSVEEQTEEFILKQNLNLKKSKFAITSERKNDVVASEENRSVTPDIIHLLSSNDMKDVQITKLTNRNKSINLKVDISAAKSEKKEIKKKKQIANEINSPIYQPESLKSTREALSLLLQDDAAISNNLTKKHENQGVSSKRSQSTSSSPKTPSAALLTEKVDDHSPTLNSRITADQQMYPSSPTCLVSTVCPSSQAISPHDSQCSIATVSVLAPDRKSARELLLILSLTAARLDAALTMPKDKQETRSTSRTGTQTRRNGSLTAIS